MYSREMIQYLQDSIFLLITKKHFPLVHLSVPSTTHTHTNLYPPAPGTLQLFSALNEKRRSQLSKKQRREKQPRKKRI